MKVFWDTNLFIYLWEKGTQTRLAQTCADWIIRENHQLVTSALTLGEILVHPTIANDTPRIEQYTKAFNTLEIIPFDTPAAQAFARLRADNKSLRPPDAFQLACALKARATLFITDDARLTHTRTPTTLHLHSLSTWAQTIVPRE